MRQRERHIRHVCVHARNSFKRLLSVIACLQSFSQDHLFHIPTSGLVIMVIIAAVEAFLGMQSRSLGVPIISLSVAVWSWVIFIVLNLFYV